MRRFRSSFVRWYSLQLRAKFLMGTNCIICIIVTRYAYAICMTHCEYVIKEKVKFREPIYDAIFCPGQLSIINVTIYILIYILYLRFQLRCIE